METMRSRCWNSEQCDCIYTEPTQGLQVRIINIKQMLNLLMQQSMNSTSPTSRLISNMPQHVPRIIGVLLHAIVGPRYCRHPCRDDTQICPTWELPWVEVVVDYDWDAACAPSDDL